MPPHSRLAMLAAAGAVVLALAVIVTVGGLSRRSSSKGSSPAAASASGFEGAQLPAGGPARDFTLTDQHGRRVSLRAYRGAVTVLTFLYSTCPTTCVLIGQQIRGALDELGPAVPTLAVSVDPAGDTPAHVAAFLRKVSLAGRVEYLTGSRAELAKVWRAYRIVPASAGEAAYTRFASVFLLDRRGRERVAYQLEQLTPEGLARDIRRLRLMR